MLNLLNSINMGIFSSGLNLVGTEMTNAANRQIAAETNYHNKQMHQQALEHEKQLAREAQAFTKSENELAYQREIEMWNMQNAYNSPSEQMRRFQEAGLNPNLIYGQGTAGNATSAPSYNATQGVKANVPTPPYSKPHKNQAPHFDFNLLQDYQVLSGINEMKENGAMQRDLMREEIEEKRISNRFRETKENLDLEMQGVQIAKERGLIDESTARYEYQKIQNKYADQKFQLDIDQQIANLDLSRLQHKIQSSQSILDDQIKQEMVAKVKAETQHIKNQSDVAKAQAQSFIDKLGAEKVRNRIMEQTGIDISNGGELNSVLALAGRLGLNIVDFFNSFF